MKKLLLILIVTVLTACASSRPPVPVGTIPKPPPLSLSDEQYGHRVLGDLTRRFPLDTNDKRIGRVRNVVEKLTKSDLTGSDPWHVYVLVDNEFKNAAATRGNHIFIWTAMIDQLRNNDELASILAHEVAHVLAGHTNPDPAEQVSEILSGVAGIATRITVQGSNASGLAQVSGALVKELIKGLIVNPGTQRKELEADHVGLMLMAEAKYDPRKAIKFWERAQRDPDFGGGRSSAFFSSHPSSVKRLESLNAALPEAMKRYRGEKRSYKPKKKKSKKKAKPAKTLQPPPPVTDVDTGDASDFVVN